MFETQTVFVLGAGASWHYGYPTGEQLVTDVVQMATRLKTECVRRTKYPYNPSVPQYAADIDGRRYWADLAKQCDDLTTRLKTVHPLVIDYFLGWNPTLRDIGRLLIAAVMLTCEARFSNEKGNFNRKLLANQGPMKLSPSEFQQFDIRAFKDNWYRFVIHQIASKCETPSDLFKNRVRFITFNYDYSLEQHLAHALLAIDTFKNQNISSFISDRVLHVYGSIRDSLPNEFELKENLEIGSPTTAWNRKDTEVSDAWNGFLDSCFRAAANIRTINSHDKEHEPTLTKAQGWIADAQRVFILGYGFDRTNSERIGLSVLSSRGSSKAVYFTNFNDANSVNKRVGELAGNHRYFLGPSTVDTLNGGFFEKSTRDVYEALELDFGLT